MKSDYMCPNCEGRGEVEADSGSKPTSKKYTCPVCVGKTRITYEQLCYYIRCEKLHDI